MKAYYRTKAAELYARARNESDVMTRRQYENLASQYSRLAETTDRGRDRPSPAFSAWRMIRMTAFFKPLEFSLCTDSAKIAAGIPSATNMQNTSLSLIYRCQMGQSGHEVFCSIGRTPTLRPA
jgi:hypothetical protein